MEQSTASYAMKENDFLSSSKFLRCKFRTDSELEGKDGMAWRLWGALNGVAGLQLDLGEETDISWTAGLHAVSHHMKRLQPMGDQWNYM